MDSPISEEEQPPPLLPHQSPRREEPPKECFHKTKTIQFFSRPTPIILQDYNGPCPLLAICNVLLLRNQLNLSADISEVSQEKLLSLVEERLIDSNSNTDKISDAIDLLPRLATWIDVNIKFQRIDDFEFTRECAIFDLLDIPLYHGWLVDPQDYATAKAIESKSYNTITLDLASLQDIVGKAKDKSQEDCIDFAAATAATLGVPSPPRVRRGDLEEEEPLRRVLKLSENESSIGESNSIAAGSNEENVIVSSNENLHQMQTAPTSSIDEQHEDDHNGKVHGVPSVSGGTVLSYSMGDLISFEELDRSSANETKPSDQFSVTQSEGSLLDDLTNVATGSILDQDIQLESSTDDHNGKVHGEPSSESGGTDLSYSRDDLISFEEPDRSSANETKPNDQFSVTQSKGSWLYDLIYVDTGEEHISNFLKYNASQLTVHGLFSLQGGLKEGELCVFFRNNHFCTMFKFEGELYVLTTDQGYLNQPGIVWEKLNEVNGDSVFYDSDFKEFRPELQQESEQQQPQRRAVPQQPPAPKLTPIDEEVDLTDIIKRVDKCIVQLQEKQAKSHGPHGKTKSKNKVKICISKTAIAEMIDLLHTVRNLMVDTSPGASGTYRGTNVPEPSESSEDDVETSEVKSYRGSRSPMAALVEEEPPHYSDSVAVRSLATGKRTYDVVDSALRLCAKLKGER